MREYGGTFSAASSVMRACGSSFRTCSAAVTPAGPAPMIRWCMGRES